VFYINISIYFATAYQISSKYPQRSYDVISIFQDGGRRVGNLFPASVFNDGTR